MIHRFIFFLVILLFNLNSCPATHICKADLQILNRFWSYANNHNLAELPVNERIPTIARFFLNTPYQSNTLNVTKEELPVINLRELDCVTFVENVLALSLLPEYNEKFIDSFVANIVKLRYRNGEIIDYTSRLHYSSDWLFEMQNQQILTDLTLFAGGVSYNPNVNFMSKHYDRYPPLKQDPHLLSKIKEIETAINNRTYYYIPKQQVNKAGSKIKEGDIILITTHIKGLDTSHLGFAIKKDGKTYLLHASSSSKKVTISEMPLQEYMSGISSQSGIMLARVAKAMPSQLLSD